MPAGITTSNPELMEGLVVGYKGPRVFLYQNSTVKAAVELVLRESSCTVHAVEALPVAGKTRVLIILVVHLSSIKEYAFEMVFSSDHISRMYWNR